MEFVDLSDVVPGFVATMKSYDGVGNDIEKGQGHVIGYREVFNKFSSELGETQEIPSLF